MNLFKFEDETERRHYPRHRFAEPVSIHIVHPEHVSGSLSADISGGGLRLKVTDYIAPGTALVVKFETQDLKVIEAYAYVAWCEKDRFNERYQVGIRFDEDNNEFTRNTVNTFLESHIKAV